MANLRYEKGAEGVCAANFDLLSDDIRIVCFDSGYTRNAADEFLSAIPAGNRVSTAGPLTGKTTTSGVFNATGGLVMSSVPAGDTIVGAALYKHTGSDATARLLVFWDRDSGDNAISVPTNGSDITITMPAGGVPISSN